MPLTARRPHFYRVSISVTVRLLTQVSVGNIYAIKPKERCPEVSPILRGTPCILKNILRGLGWGREGGETVSFWLLCLVFIYIWAVELHL